VAGGIIFVYRRRRCTSAVAAGDNDVKPSDAESPTPARKHGKSSQIWEPDDQPNTAAPVPCTYVMAASPATPRLTPLSPSFFTPDGSPTPRPASLVGDGSPLPRSNVAVIPRNLGDDFHQADFNLTTVQHRATANLSEEEHREAVAILIEAVQQAASPTVRPPGSDIPITASTPPRPWRAGGLYKPGSFNSSPPRSPSPRRYETLVGSRSPSPTRGERASSFGIQDGSPRLPYDERRSSKAGQQLTSPWRP
jgi:hypothetical protein